MTLGQRFAMGWLIGVAMQLLYTPWIGFVATVAILLILSNYFDPTNPEDPDDR